MPLPNYDSWRTDAPEDSKFQQWLDRLTLDEVLDICCEKITVLWQQGDKWVMDVLSEYFEALPE